MQMIATEPRLTTEPETANELQASVCMPTWRGFTRRAFQCGLYEAQDVLAEANCAQLVPVEANPRFAAREPLQRRMLYHDLTRRLVYRNPGLQNIRLTQKYDAFIAVCQSHAEFLYLSAIENWKDRCKVSICWIDELWASRLPLYKYWLHALNRFDYVFTGNRGTVIPLSQAIGKPVYWMPGGVDTLRFSPYPNYPERVIDVYSIGRRSHAMHQALLRLSENEKFFYCFDTAQGADGNTFDDRQHRVHFANMAKRSRYFIVGPAKFDDLAETRGQIEFGPRYYEGAAAGAILLGQGASRHPAFHEMLGWPDAVIEVQQDGSDVAAVVAELDADPDRQRRISRRNAAEALRRHDWIYRWKEMFRVAGIPPSRGMLERERRLKELACLVEQGW